MKSDLENIGMHAGASPEIFRKAEMLRSNMTQPEKLLWEFLKLKPLGYKFRRQHPFGIYILDFYCHKCKLSIEFDGKSHENQIQNQYDKERTKFIESFGIIEIRFSNLDILNKFNDVQFFILSKVREATL